MGANTTNALLFLFKAIFNLYLGAVLLRILLQQVRADFFNPMSQLVWKVTQPVVAPLQKVVPRFKRFDTAAAALLVVLSYVFVMVVVTILSVRVGLIESLVYTVYKVVGLVIAVYSLSIAAQAILSWVGPGVNNRAANVLYSLNEPLLRPVRRVIPLIANVDLSPLVVILLLQFLSYLLPLPAPFR